MGTQANTAQDEEKARVKKKPARLTASGFNTLQPNRTLQPLKIEVHKMYVPDFDQIVRRSCQPAPAIIAKWAHGNVRWLICSTAHRNRNRDRSGAGVLRYQRNAMQLAFRRAAKIMSPHRQIATEKISTTSFSCRKGRSAREKRLSARRRFFLCSTFAHF